MSDTDPHAMAGHRGTAERRRANADAESVTKVRCSIGGRDGFVVSPKCLSTRE